MDEQIPISPAARADEIDQDGLHQVLPDVAYKRLAIVNVVFVGAKGAGEAGTAGAPAALMNAINDALRPLGARVTEQPFTPERILRALGAIR